MNQNNNFACVLFKDKLKLFFFFTGPDTFDISLHLDVTEGVLKIASGCAVRHIKVLWFE